MEVGAASPGGSRVVIAVAASVVSAGTERMLVDFGRASLIGKARSQPQRVVEVANKVLTDGLSATAASVRSKLAEPIALGYSCSGMILESGSSGLEPGTLVAAAGPHAEVTSVSRNLVVPVPDGVTAESAAFATIGSIAMQGLRLAEPTIGERFVVTGLGLVGLLAVQLLRAQGCQVLGVDPDPARRELAETFGAATVDSAADVVAAGMSFSDGAGVDGVIVCASTSSSVPIKQAATMCRKRGRIVLVGVTGLELDRADFYEKELSFQVSASYGPGRYDPSYEDKGVDYPHGFVRWTAGRNMAAVLDLMADGKLDVSALTTHRYPFESAPDAYETLVSEPSALGIILEYAEPDLGESSPLRQRSVELPVTAPGPAGSATVGVLGAGNFASQILLPAITAAEGNIHTIVSSGGTSATLAAGRFGATRASTDPSDVFEEGSISTVVVATRHDSHARYVTEALDRGKHVFVEKPLAISVEELIALRTHIEAMAAQGTAVPLIGVGFNRRFAPITVRMADLLSRQRAPKALTLTMNAGEIPANHWTQDPDVGGGRIVGEACHLIDLARFLVGAEITDVSSTFLDASTADTALISLTFADGSIATVNYLANGSKRYPKERVEVFCGGRVLVNDNFRTMRAYGWKGVRTMRLRRQDKGHVAGVAAFLDAVRKGGPAPIPLAELFEVSEVALRAARMA